MNNELKIELTSYSDTKPIFGLRAKTSLKSLDMLIQTKL